MSCRHRFYDNLIPNVDNPEYLFIGTFNPIWNAINGNNADYFYGRETNLFWCIVPHAFENNCLINKGVEEWIDFCNSKNHKIVLTDLIKEVTNADIENPTHFNLLASGFQDKSLEKKINNELVFDLEFNTKDIKAFISNKSNTIKGVFLTRSSFQGIPQIFNAWSEIKQHCSDLNLYCNELPTPSPRGRNSGIRTKINYYKQELNNCRQHRV